jgi:hypothetical protein
MKARKRKKSLVGFTETGWNRYFRFSRKAIRASIPELWRYPKGKFFFAQYRKVKVRITIEELEGK